MIKLYRFFMLLSFFNVINLYSMIDNRFLPLYRQQYIYKTPCRPSSFATNMFFLISSKASNSECKDIGLAELNGKYDLIKVTDALDQIGKNPPLATQTRITPKLELDLEGKLEGQGAWLGYEQNFFDNFYIGISTYLMHINSRQNFVIPDSIKREIKLIRGSETQFDKDLRDTNNLLGINCYQFSKTGVSDIDLYLRFGTIKDYYYKFRKLDLGISLGALIPAGPNFEINNPASIPFGGNGHWGLYAMVDLNLELKEDLYFGLWFEILNRFKKIQKSRLPTFGEPLEFAPVIGNVSVDPGLTVGFSPYIALDDIRDGFGFKIRYTLIFHSEDEWSDTCKKRIFKVKDNTGKVEDRILRARLGELIDNSEWANEYLTFSLTYNFANSATKCRKFAPIVYLEWDRPTKMFMAKNVAKTNRVSFGFEFNF